MKILVDSYSNENAQLSLFGERDYDRVENPVDIDAMYGETIYQKSVLANLENSECLASSDIGYLLQLRKKIMNGGGTLILYNVSQFNKNVLQTLNITDLFTIADTKAKAIAGAASDGSDHS